MNAARTIAGVDPAGLCHGCGTCAGICPVGAIRMAMDDRRGVFHPVVAMDVCIDCGRCRAVCPGQAVDFDALNRQVFGQLPADPWMGNYRSIHIAHAVDERIRFEGSSGGLVTALLAGALKTGQIDGAVVTRMSRERPLEAESFVARTEEELKSAAGSKYAPTAPGAVLRELRGERGRFAFVGVPCQIHGLRKLQRLEPLLAEKIPLVRGLMCSNNATCAGTEYFLRRWKIRKAQVAALRFREGGWIQNYNTVVSLKDGRTVKLPRAGSRDGNRRTSYLHNSIYHCDFVLPRCLVCFDHAAELSDLAFGDPRLSQLAREGGSGKSLVIVRSAAGADLMAAAKENGWIEASPELDLDTFRKAQSMAFKMQAPARLGAYRRLGKAVPEYVTSRMRPAKARDVFSLAAYVPSFFGGHPGLRFWIRPYSAARYWVKWVAGRIARVKSKWRGQTGAAK